MTKTISEAEYREAIEIWSTLVKNGRSNDEMVAWAAARINQFEYEMERAAWLAAPAPSVLTKSSKTVRGVNARAWFYEQSFNGGTR